MDKILSPIKQRVLKYIENQKLRKKDFFTITSISASNFKGDALYSELGGDAIAKILTFYPDIDTHWLVTGEGEMFSIRSNKETDWKVEHGVLLRKYADLNEKYIACLENKTASGVAVVSNNPA